MGYVDAPGVIYYNDGMDRNFEVNPSGDGKGAIYEIVGGELDGDGRLDLVVLLVAPNLRESRHTRRLNEPRAAMI